MTDPATEAAFQAALDANPDDHVTRLVFADYLQECGDPRAEGYRALGTLARKPWIDLNGYPGANFSNGTGTCEWWEPDPKWEYATEYLPRDWFDLIESPYPYRSVRRNDDGNVLENRTVSHDYRTRRAAEDAAARAFARLPPARRAELLSQPAPA